MSAPRRTPAKNQGGASATVAPNANVAAPRTEPTPRQRPPKPNDKGKLDQPKPSVVATRIQSIRQLAIDTKSEIKKVNWPDRETVRNLAFVVIAISIILGLFLGGIDFLMVRLLDLF